MLIRKSEKYRKVLSTYLNGDDINSSINHTPSRYVINFWNRTLEESAKFDDCFEIVKTRVKPDRDKVNRERYRKIWWQFGEKCENLYRHTTELKEVIGLSRVTKYINPVILKNEGIFSDMTIIFSLNTYSFFAILNCTFHYEWCNFSSSALASTIRYNPSDCIETFPLPTDFMNKLSLTQIGRKYDKNRIELLQKIQLGLTKTYNFFHTPIINEKLLNINFSVKERMEIEKKFGKGSWTLYNHIQKLKNAYSFKDAINGIIRFRESHIELDIEVLRAYGWHDIDLKHDFYEVDYLPLNDRIRFTIHPDARKEVLKRLLELNHKIHEEEVKAGLWDKKSGNKRTPKSKTKANQVNEGEVGYGGLFG